MTAEFFRVAVLVACRDGLGRVAGLCSFSTSVAVRCRLSSDSSRADLMRGYAMSVELVKSIFDWAAVILVALTVITGAGALITGKILSDRQSAQIRQFDADLTAAKIDLAKQQERAAKAEGALRNLQLQVGWRSVNASTFLRVLDGQPRGKVEILYLRNDPECFDVSIQLRQLLTQAGWKVERWDSIPEADGGEPIAMTVDGQPSGITLVASSATREEMMAADKIIDDENATDWVKTPYTILEVGLLRAVGKVNNHIGGPHAPAAGLLRIVVAPR